jgi:hypothetical protein
MKKQSKVVTGMAFLAVAGCGISDDAPTSPTDMSLEPALVQLNHGNDTQANLIDRIYLSSDHVLELYEPEPGLIVSSEAAPVGKTPVFNSDDWRDRSLVDIHKAYAPHIPVPERLLAAVARLELPGVQSSVPGASHAEHGGGRATAPFAPPQNSADPIIEPSVGGSCDATWFTTAVLAGRLGCPTATSFNAYNWCLQDWWGGAFASSGATDLSYAASCADIGTHNFKISTSDRGGGNWTVPVGTWRNWDSNVRTCGPFSFWCDFSARYDIVNATDSRFQFGGTFLHRD